MTRVFFFSLPLYIRVKTTGREAGRERTPPPFFFLQCFSETAYLSLLFFFLSFLHGQELLVAGIKRVLLSFGCLITSSRGRCRFFPSFPFFLFIEMRHQARRMRKHRNDQRLPPLPLSAPPPNKSRTCVDLFFSSLFPPFFFSSLKGGVGGLPASRPVVFFPSPFFFPRSPPSRPKTLFPLFPLFFSSSATR